MEEEDIYMIDGESEEADDYDILPTDDSVEEVDEPEDPDSFEYDDNGDIPDPEDAPPDSPDDETIEESDEAGEIEIIGDEDLVDDYDILPTDETVEEVEEIDETTEDDGVDESEVTADILNDNIATIPTTCMVKAGDTVEIMLVNGEPTVIGVVGGENYKANTDLTNVPDGSVKTAHIEDAAITNAKIGTAAITNAKIANAAITTAKIQEGAITSATIHDGAINTAKIADGSITNAKIDALSADKITSGTIQTERLILVDDETGKTSVVTALNAAAEANGGVLSGATLIDGTVEAAKINVADLNAFEATIGGFDIDSSSIHSKKTAINDPAAGVYFGTTGIGVGDGELADVDGSPLEVYADGTFKLRGKNASLIFDPVYGDIDINATSITIGSSSVASKTDLEKFPTQTYEMYATSTSATVAPETGWSTKTPTWSEGIYIWRRVMSVYESGEIVTGEPVMITGNSGTNGEDAVTLRVESSRGTVFKNSEVSTVLSAVIYKGGQRITDINTLRATFGTTAYIEWQWQRLNDNAFGVISASDSRISQGGFTFTLTPEDVDTKVTFMCSLITD